MLNKKQFDEAFNHALDELSKVEAVTKRELRPLSRNIVSAIHGFEDANLTGDTGYINRLLPVLSPINRQMMVKYFERFSGYHYDNTLGQFTKKSPKRYLDCQKLAREKLEDPNFNVFAWGTREIEKHIRPFDESSVTKYIEGALKKAAGAGKGHAEVLGAVLKAGIPIAVVLKVVEQLAQEKAKIDAPM